MVYRLLFLLLILLSSDLALGVELRTPPLSENNFNVTFDLSPVVYENVVQNDILINNTASEGLLAPSMTVGDLSNTKFTFYMLTPQYARVSSDGYIAANVTGTAKVKVSGPMLSKIIDVPVTLTGEPASYREGTLGKNIVDFVNTAIQGKTEDDKGMFSSFDAAAKTATWSTTSIVANCDFTAMNVMRDGVFDPTRPLQWWPILMISPRHFVCGHVATAVGETYYFLSKANTMYSRTVTHYQAIDPTDIYGTNSGDTYYIGTLNSDLPGDITPVKFFPEDYFKSGKMAHCVSSSIINWPLFVTDQEKKALLHGFFDSSITTPGFNWIYPIGSPYSTFYEEVVGGDSSSPVFVIVNSQTVLMTTLYTSAYGPDYTMLLDPINAYMAAHPGDGGAIYQAQIIDLSGFPTY